MTKAELLEVWAQRVWREQDRSAIREYYEVEGVAEGLGTEHRNGPHEFELFHDAVLQLVTDVDLQITQTVEEGDWISYVGVFSATNRKTGERVQMTGSATCLIQDGKMRVAHNAWDFLAFFSQLGLLPADSFGRCLSGQRLA